MADENKEYFIDKLKEVPPAQVIEKVPGCRHSQLDARIDLDCAGALLSQASVEVGAWGEAGRACSLLSAA